MNEKTEILISTLKRLFGIPKTEKPGIVELEFNCRRPKCNGDNKYNLAFNVKKNQFHCWKCNYSGNIHTVVNDYGTKEDKERVTLVFPKSNFTKKKKTNNKKLFNEYLCCDLPKDFLPLSKKQDSWQYNKAIEYLKKRGVSDRIIKKYNIGYAEFGNLKHRIIIPSYNYNGKVNYYSARSYFEDKKPAYMGPSTSVINKQDIIFNLSNINFDLPVYIVEGVFDMLPLYNAVPMLGKKPSDFLIHKLVTHKSKVILCLDEDAIEDSICLYNIFNSYGLDVYFVKVKDDIAKFYEENGTDGLINLLKTHKKLDFKYIFKMRLKEKNLYKEKLNGKKLNQDWDSIKKNIK